MMPPISLDEMGKIRLMNRTDTKFLTYKADLLKLLSLVKNDYFVQEVSDRRISHYRTTYWDDDAHRFYVMHQNGHRTRLKVRVRTYEDSDGLTFLEIKRKDNKGKTHKKRTKVKNQTEIAESGGDKFLISHTGIELQTLHPCLQNRFKRITLVNKGMTERLTIDFDIEYNNFETLNRACSNRLVIIELKRDGMACSPVRNALTQMHIHPKGYSKYVIGSFMTNPNLKRNLIKRKWVYINKLSNQG